MKKTIGIIIIISVVIALVLIVTLITTFSTKVIYNNGICRKCNGHMVEWDIEFDYRTEHYIYKCEKCGHTIDLSVNPKDILDFTN